MNDNMMMFFISCFSLFIFRFSSILIMNCLADILDMYKDSDRSAIIFVEQNNEEKISGNE